MVVRLDIHALERILGDLPKDASEEVAHIARHLDDRDDAERTEGTAHISAHEHIPWTQSALNPAWYVLVQSSADKPLDMVVLLTTTCGVSLEVEPGTVSTKPYLRIGKHARLDFTNREELLFFLDGCTHLREFLTQPPPEGSEPA